MQLSSEQEKQETESSNYLASIVNVDSELARRMLRKHNGDVAKAADALLTGGDSAVESWEPRRRTTPDPMYADGLDTTTPTASTIVTPIPSSSVIDLTGDGDDEDLTRAIQMSMEDSSRIVPEFTSSQRAPHPDWQVVRSNVMYNFSATLSQKSSQSHIPRLQYPIQRRPMKIILWTKLFKLVSKTSPKMQIHIQSHNQFAKGGGLYHSSRLLQSGWQLQ